MQHLQRGLGRPLGDLAVVLADPSRHRFQRQVRSLFAARPVARRQVEGHLDVEHTFRQLLEGEQIHGLLVQFVHSLLAVLRRRLKHGGDHAFDFGKLPAAQGEQSEDGGGGWATTTGPGCNSGGMGWPVWRSIQRSIQGERIDAPASSSSANERSTIVSPRSRATFQLLRVERGSEAKKAKSTPLELFRADALNKAHLVAGRFQLAERLVVIEQPDIGSGKIPFVQDFGDLLALE